MNGNHCLTINFWRWVLLVVLFFIIPNLSAAGDPPSALDLFPVKVEGRTFENPRFSPDSRWLAFDLCEKKLMDRECQSVIYDITQDRYFAWRDSKGRPITNVSFSPDGTKAVFVVETNSPFLAFGKYEDRIAVGNIKDGRYSFITPGPGHKRYPEFWKDDSVIYIGTEPDDSSRRKSKYLYIAEPGKSPRKLIETGFYGPSRARPHWDGEQIVMAEYGFSRIGNPDAWRNKPLSDSGDEILSINPAVQSIAVLDIQPSGDHHQSFSGPAPALLARQVYAVVRLKEESKQARRYLYDVFIIDGAVVRRVSRIAEYIVDMDAVADGSVLAVVTADTSGRTRRDYRLLLYDTRNHARREMNPKDLQEKTIQLND